MFSEAPLTLVDTEKSRSHIGSLEQQPKQESPENQDIKQKPRIGTEIPFNARVNQCMGKRRRKRTDEL